MHNICHFQDWEVRSPTLQTVCKSELKRRSYGRLKTIAQSCAKISKLRNPLTKISQGVLQLRNHLQAHVCHFPSWNSIFPAMNHVVKSSPSCEPRCEIISKLRTKLRNHLQAVNEVAKSPPSCKIKVQTCKMDNSTCESPCEMDTFMRNPPV